jgi:hypothetical protein
MTWNRYPLNARHWHLLTVARLKALKRVSIAEQGHL